MLIDHAKAMRLRHFWISHVNITTGPTMTCPAVSR